MWKLSIISVESTGKDDVEQTKRRPR